MTTTTYYGYDIEYFEADKEFNEPEMYRVSVGGWEYDCKTLEEAKQHIREGKHNGF